MNFFKKIWEFVFEETSMADKLIAIINEAETKEERQELINYAIDSVSTNFPISNSGKEELLKLKK